MIGLLTTVLQGTALFGSEDPLAPVGRAEWHHQRLTRDAALAAGFAPHAAEVVALHATAVDLYLYHPFWCLSGGRRRLRGAAAARGPLASVHFDDLTGTAEVVATWRRITEGSVAGLLWCSAAGDVAAARHLLGVALHAVQDFYSHSNWLDDPSRRHRTWLRSVQDAAGTQDDGTHDGTHDDGTHAAGTEVWTGSFGAASSRPPHGELRLTPAVLLRLPAWLPDAVRGGVGRHPGADRSPLLAVPPRGVRPGAGGINLDSCWQAAVGTATRGLGLTAQEAFTAATALAAADSLAWLTLVAARLAAAGCDDFWHRVLTEPPVARWTDDFDHPGRRAYHFVALGADEPADGWFLRTERSARGSVLASWSGPHAEVPATVHLPPGPAGTVVVDAFRRHPEAACLRLTEPGAAAPAGRPVTLPLLRPA